MGHDLARARTHLAYEDWLPHWREHLKKNTSELPMVPQAACNINTPLNIGSWQHYLSTYPNQELVKYFLERIFKGFRIGLVTPIYPHRSAQKNLQAALLRPEVVDKYLQTELTLNRISGPFSAVKWKPSTKNLFCI